MATTPQVLFVLIYYNSYVIPLKLLFDDSTAERPSTFSSEGMVVLDAIVDACFWADMVLNFRLGFYERHAETGLPDQVVMSPSRIAARYIRLWFWVDLIAVFPIYDIFRPLIASEDADAVIGTSNPLLLLRNLRLVRMLRLFKVLRLHRHFQDWDSSHAVRNPMVWRLLRQFFWMLLGAHLVACGAYAVAAAEGFPDDGWVAQFELLPPALAEHAGHERKEWYDRWVACLYWTIMTITTVGYGDIMMKRTSERVYAILCMFLGAVLFAYMMSNVAQLVRDMDATSTAMRQRMDSINNYMRYRDLPPELQLRIRKYYTFYWSRQSIFDEHAILDALPSHLRREVTLYLHRDEGWCAFSDPTFPIHR